MYGLSSKGAPGSVNELSPVLKKIKSLKKSLMLNAHNLRATPIYVNFQFVKMK